MAHVTAAEFHGKVLIDATSVQPKLVDLEPGAMRSLKRTQDGIDEVLEELSTAIGQHADTLQINTGIVTEITDATNLLEKLGILLIEAKKLEEVLSESIAFYEDRREADLSRLASMVKSVAQRKDPSVKAAFDALLSYVSQVAVKAAATRRKNAAYDDSMDENPSSAITQ